MLRVIEADPFQRYAIKIEENELERRGEGEEGLNADLWQAELRKTVPLGQSLIINRCSML